MAAHQTAPNTPGPWRVEPVNNEFYESINGAFYIRGANNAHVARLTDENEPRGLNADFIVAACNACMAVSPDSPITVAECIPELVKLARLVTSRPEWQQAVDDLGLSNQIHKLLTCIERRHR